MMSEFRVLLVDDELEFLEPLSTRLGRRGVTCSIATSGVDALRVLGERSFDCAVVDVKMPGMDGLELLRRIRRDHPALGVVLLTGHASVELGVQGMELGAFDYLLKPVDLDELLEVARRAAQRV
jgi:two-component system, OmpR family, response regulator